MKYYKDDIIIIIDYAFKVLRNQMEKKDAVVYLHNEYGYNENSIKDLINSIGCMLEGKKYIRTISLISTEVIYDYIIENYDLDTLELALKSTDLHISYYENISGSNVVSLRTLNEKYWAKINRKPYIYNDEKLIKEEYHEGNSIDLKVNCYERNTKAREAAIKYHGCYCHICGFDFEKNTEI